MSDKHTDAQGELVAALKKLANGATNVAENAKMRGDLYDEGYAEAMAKCANDAVAKYEASRATEGQAQTSAAEAARPVQPFTVKELLAMYDDNRGDWCAIARAVEQRYITELDQTRRALAAVLLEEPVAQLADSTAPGAKCVECEGAGSINDSTGLCTVCQSLVGTTAPGAPVDRNAVLDEVKRMILGGYFLHDQAPRKLFATEVGKAIDEMKSAAPTAQQSLTAGGSVPEERWCLACDKAGHRTDECWSTHGMNTPQDRELMRLCRAAAPLPQVQSEAKQIGYVEHSKNINADFCPVETRIIWTIPHPDLLKLRGKAKVFVIDNDWDQQPVTPSGALADNDGGVAK